MILFISFIWRDKDNFFFEKKYKIINSGGTHYLLCVLSLQITYSIYFIEWRRSLPQPIRSPILGRREL